MDCRKIYGFVLLIFVPLISARCGFQEAKMCIHKVQIIYDQFKTDMLNESYVPKPSSKARICGNMEKGSREYNCFYDSLVNCSQDVQDGLKREWNALKVDHDQKCNGVCHLCSMLLLLLLVWTAISLPQ